MWFFSRNRKNLSKLEEKVTFLEDKLNQNYEEQDSINESLDALCKELRSFLTEENTSIVNDIQQEQDSIEASRQDREA